MALAVSIVLLVLLTNVLAWIGHSVLQDAAYAVYARIFVTGLYNEQKQLKSSIIQARTELNQTSAQEEFAKWAKLRRRLDKAIADLEKLNTRLSTSKSAFATKFNWLLWAATTGAQLVLVWWYRREPVFYLPPGWLGPLAYFFSLPSAPKGSVSSAAWQMACQRVIKMAERFVKDLRAPEEGPGELGKAGKQKET